MVSPSSTSQPRRPKSFLAGVLVGFVLAIAAGAVVYVGSRPTVEDRADDRSLTPSPTFAPSPTPTAAPIPITPPAIVRNTFNKDHSPSIGERVSLESYWMDPPRFPAEGCTLHSYTYRGKTHGAFESDCSDWERSGTDILIFAVGIRNISGHALTLRLRNFVLQSRDGRTFGVVNVGSDAEFPTSFLAETQKLPAKARWGGYVTFDGRVNGLVPASISYIDGKQALKQVFLGDAGRG